MKKFFDDDVLLSGNTAKELYKSVKDLPILDYHCHLNSREIAEDKVFSDIGELWLSGDHYKWRAMRLCGVDEQYMTGNASYRDKFLKYAEILPKLIGNPLYYWTHMELKQIFGINKPLNSETAEEIWEEANKKLPNLSVRKLLSFFKVEYIATTDDPVDSLDYCGKFDGTTVAPTFRPDKLFKLEESYLQRLQSVSMHKTDSLTGLLQAYKARLDYFMSKGCRIADHGYEEMPEGKVSFERAEKIYANRKNITESERDEFFLFMMNFFAREYSERGMTMQLHFSAVRNINKKMFAKIGPDSGYDVFRNETSGANLAAFLSGLNDENCLPKTVLYSLNPNVAKMLSAISGAFKNVLVGPAWWFNDTLEGIREHLKAVSEYAALGTNLGMLTDSRSFTSYCRFDFFRRILAEFIGGFVDKGEYDMQNAGRLMEDICYNNTKEFIGL